MPLPVEALTPTSSDAEIQQAISASIAQCVNEGIDQKQCTAMAYSMAKKATTKGATRLALARRGQEQAPPAPGAVPGEGMM